MTARSTFLWRASGNVDQAVPVFFGFRDFPVQQQPFRGCADGQLPRNYENAGGIMALDEIREVARHGFAIVRDQHPVLFGAQAQDPGSRTPMCKRRVVAR